jgi:hypothetical protein
MGLWVCISRSGRQSGIKQLEESRKRLKDWLGYYDKDRLEMNIQYKMRKEENGKPALEFRKEGKGTKVVGDKQHGPGLFWGG